MGNYMFRFCISQVILKADIVYTFRVKRKEIIIFHTFIIEKIVFIF